MAKSYPAQTSFNAGEISLNMLSRVDTEVYRQALLLMKNFMPRLQGPAVRSPGSAFIGSLGQQPAGRVMPYLTVDNLRSLVIFTDEAIQLITSVTEPGPVIEFGAFQTGRLRQQIVTNENFDKAGEGGDEGWNIDPILYRGGDDDPIGCWYTKRNYEGFLRCICRDWKYPEQDQDFFEITQTITVPYASDTVTFDWRMIYIDNPGTQGDEYSFTLKVGVSPGGNNVLNETVTGPVGTVTERVQTRDLPTAQFTGELFITIRCEALENASTPVFDLDRFAMLTDAPPVGDVPDIDSDEAELYRAEDLQDLQFVQSPYDNKPMVVVHPDYHPQWLFFDPQTGTYVFQPIPFLDPPDVWATGNYPSSCTSYQGRLMLAGTPEQTETVWGSRTNAWEDFSTETNGGGAVTPDSALEFTTIYRSPIQWMFGHKDLLIGAREFEYIVTSDTGLLQPADIDARLHTTHGSVHVQPAGFGKFVAFPAERGTRVRAAQKNRDDEGWIAPDLTIMSDHIVSTGVRRMIRMRNPHQMLVCVLNSGQLAIHHLDEYAGISGWSTIDLFGSVVDCCALPLPDGTDVLMLLVQRVVGGKTIMYLEGIFGWTYEQRTWIYMGSFINFIFEQPQSFIDGLEHLEGYTVQVLAERTFIGEFRVVNGRIELEEGGVPIEVAAATVGIGLPCIMRTLPPVVDSTVGLQSKKRNSQIVVRTLGSTRPIINGERPPDRDPITPMNISQSVDIIRENEVTNLGWDPFQLIEIREDVPFKVEVLSIAVRTSAKST